MIKSELKRIVKVVMMLSIVLYGIMYYIGSDVDVNKYNFEKFFDCVFNYRIFLGVYSLFFIFMICIYLKRAVVIEKIIKISNVEDYIFFLEKKLMIIAAGYSILITVLYGELFIGMFGMERVNYIILVQMLVTQFIGWLVISSLSLFVMFYFEKSAITFAVMETLTILLNFRFNLVKSDEPDFLQIHEYMYGFIHRGLFVNISKTFFYIGIIVVMYVTTVKIAQKKDFLGGKASVNNE